MWSINENQIAFFHQGLLYKLSIYFSYVVYTYIHIYRYIHLRKHHIIEMESTLKVSAEDFQKDIVNRYTGE